MRKNDKRAISAIVSTVLVLMLTFGILAFVGPKIITMVKDNLDGSTVCSQVATSVSIVKSDLYTCYDNNTTTLKVQIRRDPSEINITGIKIFASKDGSDITPANVTSAPGSGETKVFTINMSKPDKVAIMPIVMSGEQERECSKTDYVEIASC
jgi:hypothetical protein